MRRAVPLLATMLLAGCGYEEILHGLAETQANEILVALDEGGITGEKRREDGDAAGWAVAVPRGDASRAQRLLSERELPRPRAGGFGEVFGKGSMVPTPTEEHALYLHALAGELSRSVEAIDGVVEARVHLGLPQADPLRSGERPPPRAAVLVKCRPLSCDGVRALEGGIRLIVAGAADGLVPGAVSVVIAPAAGSRTAPAQPPSHRPSPVLMGLAAVAALAACGAAAAGLGGRFPWRRAA
jgi:type III secretion protein J